MESAHLSALQAKHAGLDRLIQQELTRPAPDESVIRDLKRRKLRVKDELTQH
jgi:hypothetical protein